MTSADKIIASGLVATVLLCFLGLFLGTAWEQALRHDCNLAAMQTKLYDSAHIRQICGK